MSNAKWRRALLALAESNPGDHCVWKLIGSPDLLDGYVPHADQVHDDYVDEMATPSPTEYRRIEWLEIRSERQWRAHDNAPLSRRPQDVLQARRALESLGDFELSDTREGLRLYGYRP